MNAPSLTLALVTAELERLPALPEVVADLLDYLQRSDVDTGEVARKIQRDAALATKLLRVANSSFYGMQGRVATIQDALTVLGLRVVSMLVMTAAVLDRMQKLAAGGPGQRAFWLHSAGTALCARILARHLNTASKSTAQGASPEIAYTAGLLHDIGQLILALRYPDEYARVAAYRAQHDCHQRTAEQAVLGFDHAEVGALLAVRWKFPDEIQRAIACHHAPEDHPAESLVALIHVGDVMAHLLDFPGGEDALVPNLSSVAWNRLGLDWDDFKRLLAEVDAQRADATLVLN